MQVYASSKHRCRWQLSQTPAPFLPLCSYFSLFLLTTLSRKCRREELITRQLLPQPPTSTLLKMLVMHDQQDPHLRRQLTLYFLIFAMLCFFIAKYGTLQTSSLAASFAKCCNCIRTGHRNCRGACHGSKNMLFVENKYVQQ